MLEKRVYPPDALFAKKQWYLRLYLPEKEKLLSY